MPFVSKAQRRYMYANHPEMAKRWEEHTPEGAKLPEKKKNKSEKKACVLDVIKAAAEATPPPGLRPSGGIGESSCQACVHFDGKAGCVKFSYPVGPDDVCDAFEQIDVGTDKVVQPEKPAQITSSGPEEMGVPGGEPVELPDGPMDDLKNFKFAFLLNCARAGLSQKETLESITEAKKIVKTADWGGVVKSLLDSSFLLGAGAPIVGGALTGYVARKLRGPSPSGLDDKLKAQKKKDLAAEYDRLAAEAEYKQKLREAAGKTGLIRLG